MGEDTAISWAHHTHNLRWGCKHAPREPGSTETSPECLNCYAETFDHRVGGKHWGDGPRRTFGDAYWEKPLKWNTDAARAGVRARVFCSSMADVFEVHADPAINAVMADERNRLWNLIRATPWLDWLLLTKRAENLATMLPWMTARALMGVLRAGEHEIAAAEMPWPNVWVGVTCGARSSLWRIAELRKVRAAVRFVSAEPLLEHITAEDWDRALEPDLDPGDSYNDMTEMPPSPIDWLITGDESGARRRPTDPAAVRTARDAAVRHGVAFHLKQWAGADAPGIAGTRKGPNGKIHLPMLDGRRWPDVPTGPLSPESADAVAAMQYAHGMSVDPVS